MITVYQDINFSGGSLDVSADIADLRASSGPWNDTISSIKVPAGSTVTVYQDIDFGGASLVLTADEPDLRNREMAPGVSWNDQVSSIKVSGSASGGTAAGAVKLKHSGAYVSNGDPFVLTKHDDDTFDARNTRTNQQLAFENSGALGWRPAGTFIAETQQQVRATTQPNGTSLLYREDGTRVFGEALIIEAIQ